jgi:serine/threonine-protein kinase
MLFGVLAVQMNFIRPDDLVAGMQEWAKNKSRAFGQVLVDLRLLSPTRMHLLEALAYEQLKAHGNDPEQSLANMPAPAAPVRDRLRAIPDADVQASVRRVGAAAKRTEPPEPLKPKAVAEREMSTPPLPQGDSKTDPGTDGTLSIDVSPEPPNHSVLPPLQVDTSLDDGPAPSLPPPVVPNSTPGRYRILRSFAKGGLGEVFIARDVELNREVALKEIQGRFKLDQVNEGRFLLEAEITGNLEHPGVVPVYSLGRHPDGRPYYAMRLIRGETFKDAIDTFHKADQPGRDPGERQLAFRQLLRRFIDMCNTVAYAHSRGILHRDIKPGNVMIGKYGETLMIDWGLAKSVDRSEIMATDGECTLRPMADSSLVETQQGVALGTPAYMSPEQAVGKLDTVGPTSDVYSLGATLYVLLTGKPAFTDTNLGAILVKVQMGKFPPPRAVKASTPHPLQAIVLKAMALKPEDRYPTADALAKDVEHWLADEPVSAYPEPPGCRLLRWSRRHRGLVTTAAAAVFIAAVSLGIATFLLTAANDRERQAKADAERNLEKAKIAQQQESLAKDRAQANLKLAQDAVDKYLANVADDPRLKEVDLGGLRKKLLETALPFLEQFAAESGQGDPTVVAEQARVLERLAAVEAETGDTAKAMVLLERLRKALTQLSAGGTGTPENREATARCLTQMARLMNQSRDYSKAEAAYREARETYEALAHDFPDRPEYRAAIGTSYASLGFLLNQTGRKKAADEAFRTAIGVQEALVRDFPKETAYQQDLASTQTGLANELRDSGATQDAEPFYQASMEVRRKLYEEKPGDPERRMRLAYTCYHYAELLAQRDESKGTALSFHEEALKLRTGLREEFPNMVSYRKVLVESQKAVGLQLRAVGSRSTDAERTLAQAVTTAKRLADDFPKDLSYRENLATLKREHAVALQGIRRQTDALTAYQESLQLFKALADDFPDNPHYDKELADTYLKAAFLQRTAGNKVEAENSYRTGVLLLRKLESVHPDEPEYRSALARAQFDLGYALKEMGSAKEAEVEYRAALPQFRALVADFPKETKYAILLGSILNNLAVISDDQKRPDEAWELYQECVALRRQLVKTDPSVEHRSSLAFNLINVGNFSKKTGRKKEAEEAYGEALSLYEKLAEEVPTSTYYKSQSAVMAGTLATFLRDGGRNDDAEPYYRRAVASREALVTQNPKSAPYQDELATARANLANFLDQTNRHTEAEKVYRQALEGRRVLADDNPTKAEYRTAQANLTLTVARLLDRKGGHGQDVETLFGDGIALWERLAREFPAVPSYRQSLGKAEREFAESLQRKGQVSQAETHFRAAAERFSALVQEQPNVTAYRQDAAAASNLHAILLSRMNRPGEAEATYRKALGFVQQLVEDFPDTSNYRQMQSTYQDNVAILLHNTARYKEAEAEHRTALATDEELIKKEPHNTAYRSGLSHKHSNLAAVLEKTGRKKEAEAEYNITLDIRSKLVEEYPRWGPYRHDLAYTQDCLGTLFMNMGRPKEAEAAYRAALANWEKVAADAPETPSYQVGLADAQQKLANFLRAHDRSKEATALLDRALATRLKLVGQFPADPAYRNSLGSTKAAWAVLYQYGLKDLPRADASYREAIIHAETNLASATANPTSAETLVGRQVALAMFLAKQGKTNEAEEVRAKALADMEKWLADKPQSAVFALQVGELYGDLSYTLRNHDKTMLDKAVTAYGKAIKAAEADLEKDSYTAAVARQHLRSALFGRARALSWLGKHTDSLADWDRAAELEEDDYHQDLARLGRLGALARSGKPTQATAELAAILKKWPDEPLVTYRAALVNALASATTPAGPGKTEAERRKPADELAARAVELLRKAVAQQYLTPTHFEKMQRDPDLDALRSRPDFIKLMKDLEAQAK